MRYVVFFCVIALCALSSLAPAGAAQIRLNEILADPNTDWDGDGTVNSKNDEWVEIINTGSAPIDLSRFRVSDLSAATDFRFALSGSLAPGEVRVIYGTEVVAWQSANGVGAFGFSLNNGGDTVYLYEINGVDTLVADSRVFAAAEVLDDRSVGRLPAGSDTWVVFDGMNPMSGSGPPTPTGCQPSPGTIVQCTTPTATSTWGKVKAKYKK